MVNPLFLFAARPWSKRSGVAVRRTAVVIPDETPATDAVFLLLRRLRVPLILVITVFAISVIGLTLIPGRDAGGRPHHMTVFDAFYFMSYTATTIGFGELPYAFTDAQRLWVTASIYSSVIGWAYAIGTTFSLFQEPGFRDAVSVGHFRRRVGRIKEPFLILSGFGHAGRLVSQGLDAGNRPFVVIDGQRSRIEVLTGDQLQMDPPGMSGDLTNPSFLGLAGLASQNCAGVLALTDDDQINLATVMTVHLLRPDVPVFARCSRRDTEEHMHDFSAQAVINPYDRFGGYLLVALQRPAVHQLVTWLMSPKGAPLPERRDGLATGRWVVCADGRFGAELVSDLRQAGLDVTVADPAAGDPDVRDAVGFVAGTERDTDNLSLAVHARLANPRTFLVVRQQAHSNVPLVTALDVDSVFMPTDLVAREILARVVTPRLWSFIDFALSQDEPWAEDLIDRLTRTCGARNPEIHQVDLTKQGAPGVTRWLRLGHALTLRDLLRHPDDHDVALPVVPLALVRDGRSTFAPDLDTPLLHADVLLLAAQGAAHDQLSEALYYDTVTEYVATGRPIPATWLWRRLTGQRRATPPAA